MLAIQPPFLSQYFCLRARTIPKSVHLSFFLSWEDALWQLLIIYNIQSNSIVLVPNFFCSDVIANMQSHGLVVHSYPLDDDLQPDQDEFIKALKRLRPQIVVLFHAVGITNQLFKSGRSWLDHLPKRCLLIEDAVHRVVDPTQITFLSDHHFIIDSWRKVMPLQGAACYSSLPLALIPLGHRVITTPYRYAVFWLWLKMQWYLLLAYHAKGVRLGNKFNTRANIAMLQGYDLIGDSRFPSHTLSFMTLLWRRLNFDLIYMTKANQVHLYQKLIAQTTLSPHLRLIWFDDSDATSLRGIPLVVDDSVSTRFCHHCSQSGLRLRLELKDSPWCQKRKIVYLPLGIQVSNEAIAHICTIVTTFN